MTIDQLYNSVRLDKIIKKLSVRNDPKEAKSYLFSILCESKYKKIVESLPEKEAFYYIIKILKNQLNSNTSSFYKQNNLGATKQSEIVYYEESFYRHETNFDVSRIIKYDPLNLIEALSSDDQELLLDRIIKETRNKNVIERVHQILNSEMPWWESSLFRKYYLPYPDEDCQQKIYSLRKLQDMCTVDQLRIDHMALFIKIKKTLNFIINKLIEEGLIKHTDIKNRKK